MASASTSAFSKFLNSPVGPKTIHFWAPAMKWGLVIAGLGDLARPVDQISVKQQLSLAATGLIWTRWSTIITPKNYSLATVNFFVGCTAAYQLARVAMAEKKPEEAKSS
ncbi:Mitochondrial pyruvate carrier subunit [Coemansia sp. RSA 1822]|nr:Mitochondrial pyruvate carrier subunit [Coemansia sp. RSA 638]KAJ2121357.1 Mitochondrial pyruvate carrier subunit [Coemansia sp. RSA 720]KAJ2479586.1 Mitochondrial pyruvate carrier subunit [Coemansia sp. RSA 2131]KAJ2542557.1 Mitochondrial pyruvate carrier subunit [Coemansia sp. RSA 1853]KAJ2560060.1 Mitochondrial pyruvate carrier subunit [Coemansia sp. RSA 1822]KAJ2660126.1 Mitochondrial pyruvate carrier subunit [Coemansia sp. RSA 1199]